MMLKTIIMQRKSVRDNNNDAKNNVRNDNNNTDNNCKNNIDYAETYVWNSNNNTKMMLKIIKC